MIPVKMAAGSFYDADEWRGLTRISLNDSLRAGHCVADFTTGKSPAIFGATPISG